MARRQSATSATLTADGSASGAGATPSIRAPTASLPSLRNPDRLSEADVAAAIDGLVALYCPLSSVVALSDTSVVAAFLPSAGSGSGSAGQPSHAQTVSETPTGTLTPSASASASLTVPVLDSGYASGVDEDDDEDEGKDGCAMRGSDNDGANAAHHHQNGPSLAALRADHFERAFAERWLTTFLARSEEIYFSDDDDEREGYHDDKVGTTSTGDDKRQLLVDKAACVLASFHNALDDEQDDEGVVRNLSFPLWSPGEASSSSSTGKETEDAASTTTTPPPARTIQVQLNDGALSSTDHTDVGLQSWGASIVFSELLCAAPHRFGLIPNRSAYGTPSQDSNELGGVGKQGVARLPRRILELGAGTGLVSLVLGKLLPELGVMDNDDDDDDDDDNRGEGTLVVATDYHAAVLENLERNITTNFPPSSSSSPPSSSSPHTTGPAGKTSTRVTAHALDWSAPDLATPPLDRAFDLLVATDVVYAPQHAIWLRDCASRLLAFPSGRFWLMATVRRAGKFEGISDTVQAAFAVPDGLGHHHHHHHHHQDGTSSTTTKKVLRILEEQALDRPRGVGHGDESGYKLFRIGWA
ncbi:uncharacterized protein B0I36DRAFT_359421 [Microdochium trichocladiopsis]|uniref:Methyltransferase-domain-containing protein n=1 Tax=Microdochium trichocladiopsis TaxID=1682393 RepID=A0A9P8YEC0_9PEZI|nr:uncharacterized protein B0I36DRAFT_359421 [Microdochium trichocladiopsis]KAH7037773.1 hypothetical protein B0I36DRAFT_359421 [Microdochium trichocladiopsis]